MFGGSLLIRSKNVNIVTDSLYFYYDAGNPSSYSGTGDNLLDLSGNARNALIIGGFTHDGISLNLNGTDGYIDSQQSPILNNAIDFTYEIWFKDDSGSEINHQTNLIGSYGLSATVAHASLFIQSNGEVRTVTRTSDNASITGVSTNSVIDGQWHHIVMSVSDQMRTYIDSILVNTSPNIPVGDYTSNSSIIIGSGTSQRFNQCSVAISRMYLNKALTQEEVTQNYSEEFLTFN